jgi:two-component system sensor histidine kinase UhpB
MKKSKILIVEDEIIIAKNIKKRLESINYDIVDIVFSGEEAIQTSAELSPDLVLMDIGLPGKMDGITTAKHIRDKYDIPIVFLTAYSDEHTIQRAKFTEPYGYLIKPFEEKELHSAIQIALYKDHLLKKLKEHEKQLRNLFNSSHEAILTTKFDSEIISANPASMRLFGCGNEIELLGKKLSSMLDDPNSWNLILDQLSKAGSIQNYEGRLRKQDGSGYILYVLGSAIIKKDGIEDNERIELFFADITDRKITEMKLKKSQDELRSLSAYLQTVREEERKFISREIHDDLGQSLTALKMDISWLKNNINNIDEKIFNKLNSVNQLIDTTIKSVQKISAQLRPGLLDDLGLVAAIEWQASEFEKRYGINIQLKIIEDIDPGSEVSTAIFRIFQEALTNVARHAKAKNVVTDLKLMDNLLVFTVKDNGIGISEEKSHNSKSLGLIGMQERIRTIGGTFCISGVIGKGTTLKIEVPLNNYE